MLVSIGGNCVICKNWQWEIFQKTVGTVVGEDVEAFPNNMFEFGEIRIVNGNKGAGVRVMGPNGIRLKGSGNFLGDKEGEVTFDEEGLGKYGGVGVEVIRVAVDVSLLDSKRKGDGVLDGYGVTAGEIKVLLKVGRSDVDGGAGITMIEVHITSRKVT